MRTESKWPDHNQNLATQSDFDGMYTELIANELRYDAGLPMDTIIVMNERIPLLAPFSGTETKNGKIILVDRPNTGGCFGGYNFAYNTFKYDYYLFTEEDLFVGGDYYYRKLVNKFESRPNTGFIGLIGLYTGTGYDRHCHGGVGLTRRDILERAYPEGELPHHKGGWNREKAITDGEIPFTNGIFKAGYDLEQYGEDGWSPNNFVMPYFNIRKLYDLR